NMRAAEPGDAVLSFSGGLISHFGIVRDFARPALKPDDFGSPGSNWSSNGWLLPVDWKHLATPVRPKDRIEELGPLLPKKYSPIHPISGNGNQKAYLAQIGQPVFELLTGLTDFATTPPPTSLSAIDSALSHLDDLVEKRIA